MKRNILIATAVAALLPAGLALAQSTTTPSTPSQPSSTPQDNTSPNSTRGSSPAHNQTPDRTTGDHSSHSAKGMFSSMDTDGDGRISRTEAASDQVLGRGFAQADRNGDGYLDQGEYSSHSRMGRDSNDSQSTTSDEASTNNPSPSNAPASDPSRQ